MLEQELVASHWDLRAVLRLILNSRTYQQSAIPRSTDPQAAALFAYYPVRQLDAERRDAGRELRQELRRWKKRGFSRRWRARLEL